MFVHFAGYIHFPHYYTLSLAHFPHAITRLPSRNRIQSIVTVATYMFLQTIKLTIVDHTQHTLSAVFLVSSTNRKTCKASYVLWFELHLNGNRYMTHYGLSCLYEVTSNRYMTSFWFLYC